MIGASISIAGISFLRDFCKDLSRDTNAIMFVGILPNKNMHVTWPRAIYGVDYAHVPDGLLLEGLTEFEDTIKKFDEAYEQWKRSVEEEEEKRKKLQTESRKVKKAEYNKKARKAKKM